MIRVRELSHDYEGKGRYAVSNIGFEIPDGKIFGFLGPSGSGKSTVQNIMTALLPIQTGDIQYDGLSVRDLKPSFFNAVGYSFELPNLYGKLTGYENLKFFSGLFKTETEDPLRVLDAVGLLQDASKRVGRYSKGMKQRLLFARSIINKPSILFLDEPMSGLDPTTSARIKEIILEKKAAGVTIFLTTHNMYAADELCDEVAFLYEGAIIAKDTPRNLKLAHGEKSVRVEYKSNGALAAEILFPEKEEDARKLNELLTTGKAETVHSQEATLEQIFITMTGRGLS